MAYFINHKLIKDQDGYIVELYLDHQLYEFSQEFFGVHRKGAKPQETDNFESSVENYLKEKLPGLKVKVVHIMLGSLLVASIPFGANSSEEGVPTTVSVQPQETTTYTVKAGDSLYSIAKRFGTTVSALKATNGLTSDLINVGQPLKIGNTGVYTVQPGDSLYSIAKRFDTTVAALKATNGLTSDVINVGQPLKIVNARVHTVQPGDTLYKISKQYNITMEQLKYENRLTGDSLTVGQTLKIPKIISNPDSQLVLVNKSNNLASTYVPANLVVPNVTFSFREYDDKKLMRQDAASALEELFKSAKADGINLFAVSGYRSYSTQSSIFTSNVTRSGSVEAANQFSAIPGQSEHQTGLAMDITSASVNYGLSQSFGDTKEGKWVKENAYRFGFIIRYQKGKESITRYQYEPWHLRYVGKETAKEITSRNITLEEYLGAK